MLTKTHQKLCISMALTSTVHNKQPKLHTWRYVSVSSVFSFTVCTFYCACLNSASDNFFRRVLSLETYHVSHVVVAMTSPFSTTFVLRQTCVFTAHLPGRFRKRKLPQTPVFANFNVQVGPKVIKIHVSLT